MPALGWAAGAGPVVVHDDGGWCWFQDERVIWHEGALIGGAVASGGERRGNIELFRYNPASGERSSVVLHRPGDAGQVKQWYDDHNVPALWRRPDGRLLAVYAQHHVDEKIYTRLGRWGEWDAERVVVPSPKSKVTYSNLCYLPKENGGKGRLYDFFRGLDDSFKPSYMESDDQGASWHAGHVIIDVPSNFKHRPYAKYTSDGGDTVHVAYTDGHPRDFDNSLYHVFYRKGMLHHSDGRPIRRLEEGLKSPDEGTRIFQGNPANVAWCADMHLDPKGRPVIVYSVQKDSAGLPPGQGGEDHRYRYARWDGRQWQDEEIAHAGSKLYAREDDYTGLAAVDPHDHRTVFISTNAEPVSGERMPHWEIFRGRRNPKGWTWKAVTENSVADNVRPVIPIGGGSMRAVLWLRGQMRSYTDYRFEVVALVEKR
jgi:hypothetical protein